jgi:hypothetical protein
VIDALTRDVLQKCVRRETRSLLQYAVTVSPWVGPADRPKLARLKDMAAAEQAATDAIGQFLQKQQAGLGHMETFPSAFTTVNDAALSYLLPTIVREHRDNIAALEADLSHVNYQTASDLIAELLRLKRQHVAELDALSPQAHTVWK